MTDEKQEQADVRGMTLRLPTTLRERIGDLAKKNHRSVHGQIIALLEEALEREEKSTKKKEASNA